MRYLCLLLCISTFAGDPIKLEPTKFYGHTVYTGTHAVYENRPMERGRKINLNIMVLPATNEDEPEKEPLFVIAGGPGQGSTLLAGFFGTWPDIRRNRDIVLVDQRGTGSSHQLHCEEESLEEIMASILAFRFADNKDCIEKFDADLRYYTTPIAMDDLNEVRKGLGYDKIAIWGGSYGSRAALVYMRRHPETIHAVVINGVNTTLHPVPQTFPWSAQKAFDGLIEDCMADDECGKKYPKIQSELDEILARLSKKPIKVKVTDPRNQADAEIKLDNEYFATGILFQLYDAGSAAALPKLIHQAHEGDFKPIADSIVNFSILLSNQLSYGMTLAVLCSEDVPHYNQELIAKMEKDSFLTNVLGTGFTEACKLFPQAWLPETYHTPVQSDVPVLMLSGQYDPVTPPEHAEEALKTLSNARHVIVPHKGHFVLTSGCERSIMENFLDNPDPKNLDTSCVEDIERPPFPK